MKPAKPDERRGYHDDVHKALQWANQLTLKFNHDHLGSEHLLGGLLHDDTGAAARLLRDLGVDPRRLKKKLLEALVPGTDMVTSSRVPRTPCLAAQSKARRRLPTSWAIRKSTPAICCSASRRVMAWRRSCCGRRASRSSPCAVASAGRAAVRLVTRRRGRRAMGRGRAGNCPP